jgi:molybdopterin biosynthesis enzyme
VPQHTNSAMDGYAIRGEDLELEKKKKSVKDYFNE